MSRSEWWHQLLVIVPDNVEVLDTSVLWISGGYNGEDDDEVAIDSFDVQFMADIAVTNKMTTAILYQVPNQPIVFAEDVLQDTRDEDGSIAFTWWHFLFDPDYNAEYLLYLPMTKAAVKAMDSIKLFLTDENSPEEIQGTNLNPTKYIVGGASKRGWTTWITAAVDPRVIGIMPTIMDELNFVKNIKHHWQSYGGWTFVFEDYWILNLTQHWDDPKMQEMFDIIDVYEYREKLLMPKLVICAANDEFFLPTNTRYWWKDMQDEYELNRLLLVPNSGHSGEVLITKTPVVETWINQVLEANKALEVENKNFNLISERSTYMKDLSLYLNIPKFSWTHETDTGDIIVTSEEAPEKVELWSAVSCNDKRRDWRLANLDETCECGLWDDGICFNTGSMWQSEVLEETSPGNCFD